MENNKIRILTTLLMNTFSFSTGIFKPGFNLPDAYNSNN